MVAWFRKWGRVILYIILKAEPISLLVVWMWVVEKQESDPASFSLV